MSVGENTSHGEGPERHNRIFKEDNNMEPMELMDIIKWTLISVLIYWIIAEAHFDDRY